MFDLARDTVEIQQELAEESFEAAEEMLDSVEDATEETMQGTSNPFLDGLETYRKSLDATYDMLA